VKDNARLMASASASSGDVTSDMSSLQAAKQSPLWFRITTPTPIRLEDLNMAPSTLSKTVPVGGGVHLTEEELDSRERFTKIQINHINIYLNLLSKRMGMLHSLSITKLIPCLP
jgi:hypothetical protein